MKADLNIAKEKMGKCIDSLQYELSSIRAGRANPAVLDKILVDYYGTPTNINQMAAISVTEARVLAIQPWDATALQAIEKAIQASDLGINPTNDGKVIRVAFPQLTEERRKELVRLVSKYGEESKISVRNVRREALDKFKQMKKDSEITEDELKGIEKSVQNITDDYVKKIDDIVAEKQEEIMSI
ncbi:MAG: ribosome recycling factor [Clostridiales bacterium]|nr:ribosome recycling factor [Clostridiales bacterium]